jgi:hypothetical protein
MNGFQFFQFQFKLHFLDGTLPNAVKTQIWIAVTIYLFVAILKKRLNLLGTLHTILQILEANVFEKRSIIQAVKDADKQEPLPVLCNRLNLLDS